jgi:hypothetical protein
VHLKKNVRRFPHDSGAREPLLNLPSKKRVMVEGVCHGPEGESYHALKVVVLSASGALLLSNKKTKKRSKEYKRSL